MHQAHPGLSDSALGEESRVHRVLGDRLRARLDDGGAIRVGEHIGPQIPQVRLFVGVVGLQ